MKSYTVQITKGKFGLSKGISTTKTYYNIKAESMEKACAIAEEKYEKEFSETKKQPFFEWLFAHFVQRATNE